MEHVSPCAFDRIVAPLSRESFLSEHWGKSFVRVRGQAGRFESMLSWSELNSILEECRLEPPRLRLFRDGTAIEAERYVAQKGGLLRLKAASLVNCLAEGATLILDSIHELAPGVREVAESCQDVLRAETEVNLYASWRTQAGFGLHWDAQDTMILQVSGRKHWKVYRPTRLHPLTDDIEKPPQPTEAPDWDGILEDGDMIYLPRGWWHVAVPLDEPSLHLTVTILPATGQDLIGWFMSDLKRRAEVRMNVPHLASVADQKSYVSGMRKLVLESWDDDILERFLAERESNFFVRSKINLPLAPIECTMSIAMETRVRLAANHRLSFLKGVGNSVTFHANGVLWHCAADFAAALGHLEGTTCRSVGQLCAQLPDQSATSRLIAFLTALAIGGAIWIERPAPCQG